MFRLFLILALLIVAIAYLYDWLKKNRSQTASKGDAPPKKIYKRYQEKSKPQESWVQVFETATSEEANRLKARLEEEDVRVVIVEQAKKDLQGNVPPGISLIVPKSHLRAAQNLICRYLEQH